MACESCVNFSLLYFFKKRAQRWSTLRTATGLSAQGPHAHPQKPTVRALHTETLNCSPDEQVAQVATSIGAIAARPRESACLSGLDPPGRTVHRAPLDSREATRHMWGWGWSFHATGHFPFRVLHGHLHHQQRHDDLSFSAGCRPRWQHSTSALCHGPTATTFLVRVRSGR